MVRLMLSAYFSAYPATARKIPSGIRILSALQKLRPLLLMCTGVSKYRAYRNQLADQLSYEYQQMNSDALQISGDRPHSGEHA